MNPLVVKNRWWPRVGPALCLAVLALALPMAANAADAAPAPKRAKAKAEPAAVAASEFAAARARFKTAIQLPEDRDPFPTPPTDEYVRMSYTSPAGELVAFHTPDPKDSRRRPAIIWLHGGDVCALSDGFWEAMEIDNEQSASAYSDLRIVMVRPTLRGGNQNPGRREAWYGEVDDVLALARQVARLPFVDPDRIYLGGHSTGATLALLVAETGARFRGVFAFGPRASIERHGTYRTVDWMPKQPPQEARMRSPLFWMDGVRSPTFVIEGAKAEGTADDLLEMRQANRNPGLRFLLVPSANHYTVLGPSNELIAGKLLFDEAADGIQLSEDELEQQLRRRLGKRLR